MPRSFDTEEIFKQANDDLIPLGIHISQDQLRFDYEDLCYHLYNLSKTDTNKYYALVRKMAEKDFFFFAYYVLNFQLDHPYLIARCYEAQDLKDEKYVLYLAARDHYKSALMTLAMSIWEVILNPNITIAIFSFQRDKSIAQLLSIKQIVETNELLKAVWPDIFFQRKGQSETRWNLYTGLFVKRVSTVKEGTFSAWGLIEGCQSHHFDLIITDDGVTDDNSYSAEQIETVKNSYRKHAGLGTRQVRLKTISTPFDVNDLTAMLLKDDRYKKIVIPGEVTEEGKGKINSIPVYKTRAELDNIRLDFGDNYYASQILQDPTASTERGLKLEWLTHYGKLPKTLNKYILCDPANAKNKSSDFTVMAVVGVDVNRQAFLIDMIRDKMDVYERFEALKSLYQKYDPLDVYYESQGLMSDLEVFDREMEKSKFYFPITKFASNVQNSKVKMINALGSEFRKKNFLLPKELYYIDITGVERELISEFVNEEYTKFPHNKAHDDMLNAMALITQIDVIYPDEEDAAEEDKTKTFSYSDLAEPFKTTNNETTWMSSFVW